MHRSSVPRYEHRQGGGYTRLSFVVALALLPALYALDSRAGAVLVIVTPLLLVAFVAFDGLTTRVNADEITWQFGHLGWPRGRARLSDIDVASITRTTFWEGWGIRLTRRGWLYNVSGYDAVLIRRRNGKSFLLGTDEPRRLKAAIDTRLQRAPSQL